MSLPATQTVAEIRQRAMDIEGVGRRGNSRQNLKAMVTQSIIKSHRMLYARHWWIRRRIIVDIPLTVDNRIYDIPDNVQPGYFEFVWAENADGRTSIMDPGLRPNERDAFIIETQGRPRLWDIVDNKIHIGPAPSEDWVKINIQCQEREDPVVDDKDFIQVDDVILVLYAQKSIRSYFGDAYQDILDDIRSYESDLASSKSTKEGFQIGGKQAAVVRYGAQLRNRLTEGDAGYYRNSNGLVYPNGC